MGVEAEKNIRAPGGSMRQHASWHACILSRQQQQQQYIVLSSILYTPTRFLNLLLKLMLAESIFSL